MYEKTSDGLAVLTQTCDLMPRPGRDRPFVALAPLVKLPAAEQSQASRGRMPRYAPLPSFGNGSFYVDLDRITTVETGILLLHEIEPGLTTDAERNDFARDQ